MYKYTYNYTISIPVNSGVEFESVSGLLAPVVDKIYQFIKNTVKIYN